MGSKARQTKMKKGLLICFLLFACIGVFLRFKGLSKNPPGFYVDEASIAENAYQIMTKGTDEWGVPYPVYFKAFGEYKNPLFIYSLAFTFKVFGVSVETTRATSALWGLATVFALGLLSQSLARKKEWLFLGILMALFYPWHFYSSRIAFEAISMPFFMTITLIAVAKYTRHPRFTYLLIGIIATALMFYSYTSARLLSPIFALAIIGIGTKKYLQKSFLLCLFYVLLLMPAITWNYATSGSLLTRYEQIKNVSFNENINTYLNQFSPTLWLGSGDTNLHHTAKKGLLPISYLPFFVVGIFAALQKWRQPLNAILILALVTAPIPASLTNTDPNALRMIHLIPILIATICIGIQTFLKTSFKFKRHLLLFFALAVISEHAHFFYTFNTTFKDVANWWFDAPFVSLAPVLKNTKEPLWIHHYLLHDSHQVTHTFLCHTTNSCQPKKLNFSEDANKFIEGATNIYFGDDCQKIKTENTVVIVDQQDKYCIYQ